MTVAGRCRETGGERSHGKSTRIEAGTRDRSGSGPYHPRTGAALALSLAGGQA